MPYTRGMIGRYRKSQEGNKSRFYFLLSIVFIFVMIKWGFPLFIKVIAGNGVTVNKTETDIIPPQPPILSAVPEATNTAMVTIEGYTEAGADLELMVNDTLNKADKSKEDGSFSFNADLSAGANRVQIRAVDAANNSSLSEIKIINVDKEPIVLTVTSPKEGTEYIGKSSQSIEITGKTSKSNAQVMANNSFVDVNKDGSFVQRIQLKDGENILKIVASDKAGNVDEQTIKVSYTP